MGDALPKFVSPMLAQIGKPFDSEDYLFEVKWDGTRAIALIGGDGEPGYRLHNRRKRLRRSTKSADLAASAPPPKLIDQEHRQELVMEHSWHFGPKALVRCGSVSFSREGTSSCMSIIPSKPDMRLTRRYGLSS